MIEQVSVGRAAYKIVVDHIRQLFPSGTGEPWNMCHGNQGRGVKRRRKVAVLARLQMTGLR